MSLRSASTGVSTRSTRSARSSASRAALRRRPMPTFIPARGRTLHLAGVCVNRIGTIDSSVFSFQAKVQVDFGSTYDGGTLFVKTAGGAWGKIAYEYSPQKLPTIVSVITK